MTSIFDLGTTGTRSKVLHRTYPRDHHRRWSALCQARGGRRFLIVIGEADSMGRAFPDRTICQQCERAAE